MSRLACQVWKIFNFHPWIQLPVEIGALPELPHVRMLTKKSEPLLGMSALYDITAGWYPGISFVFFKHFLKATRDMFFLYLFEEAVSSKYSTVWVCVSEPSGKEETWDNFSKYWFIYTKMKKTQARKKRGQWKNKQTHITQLKSNKRSNKHKKGTYIPWLIRPPTKGSRTTLTTELSKM